MTYTKDAQRAGLAVPENGEARGQAGFRNQANTDSSDCAAPGACCAMPDARWCKRKCFQGQGLRIALTVEATRAAERASALQAAGVAHAERQEFPLVWHGRFCDHAAAGSAIVETLALPRERLSDAMRRELRRYVGSARTLREARAAMLRTATALVEAMTPRELARAAAQFGQWSEMQRESELPSLRGDDRRVAALGHRRGLNAAKVLPAVREARAAAFRGVVEGDGWQRAWQLAHEAGVNAIHAFDFSSECDEDDEADVQRAVQEANKASAKVWWGFIERVLRGAERAAIDELARTAAQ